jgi:seryl-tRNA synthetase
MPGRKSFGEISSASSCVDYQVIAERCVTTRLTLSKARRLNIRAQSPAASGTSSKRFAFTLNGTALAVPRIILAILETHQQKDGSIVLPSALQPFLGGKAVLTPTPHLLR